MATPQHPSSLDQFLQPLHIDVRKCHALSRSLWFTYVKLAKESEEQFLPTPISDSVLRPDEDAEGRYLAIDIGGTNLRVGFVELQSSTITYSTSNQDAEVTNGVKPRVIRHLEKSWPIGEQLKNNQAGDLFAWIGGCIREVVRDGSKKWPGDLPEEIPLGVTFSFPMIQHTLSDATLMAMGKGFAMNANLDLGKHLVEGYSATSLTPNPFPLPRIKITAIANDSVATLISFIYLQRNNPLRKPAMGLIVGTGTNATIPLALSKLHPSKHPSNLQFIKTSNENQPTDPKIAVNTEWTIKGASPPLHEHNIITKWDAQLDAEGSAPGFQPFEYMTSGLYLGELGRLIILDYFVNHLLLPASGLPEKLGVRNGLSTTFLGLVRPEGIIEQLNRELSPPSLELNDGSGEESFEWTAGRAEVVYKVAKAIQVRGSAMIAAAILGLLACADELDFSSQKSQSESQSREATELEVEELLVGYTGGCIDHFQEYLNECQKFLDEVVVEEFGSQKKPRVVLVPCHDGGIIGAGILAGTVKNMLGA